ncbi:MAG TPA: bifunctional nuclease family protein [Anaerolineales bacterium]|nr:bifunctional nuclease family protein [Anaerolineales bacterium]
MSDMVEVVIDSVRVSLMSPQRVVVLRQTEVERYLPIWVGQFEAEAITVALQEVEVSRPFTHDLLKNVFTLLKGKILRVEIVSLKEDTFFGNIVVEADGKILDIDSRPSDAIALAVRIHVPILVSQDVMDAAGIVPERDIQADTGPETREDKTRPLPRSSETGTESQESEKGLDVFEDFLKKLKDDPGDEEKPKS